jgi:zinc protease
VMGVFHDVLTGPEFRQEKIDLAKSQLRSGISRRNDSAQGIGPREFADILYGKDTPYGWSVEYATLGRIARGDLQSFYQRYFFPSNVMLAVWGDFKTGEMKSKIEKLFGGWTAQQEPVPPFPKVSSKGAPGVYLAVKKDVTQTFLTIGELGGEFRDKDYPALEIMGDILGGGFQSRLFQQVRTKMGNAYEVSASWSANYDHPGFFEIGAGTKSHSTVETIRAIQQEVERMRTTEVTAEELAAAKDTALNSLVFAFDSRTKTLGRMLTYEYYGYPKDFIQQYQKALAAVTRADVLRVAKQHLDPARFTIVAVGNPDMFDKPLESLGGPVTAIDLTIPEPKAEPSKADAGSLDKGRQLLEKAQKAAGGVEKLAEIKDYLQNSEFQLGNPQAGGMTVKETNRWIKPAYFRQDSTVPAGKIAAYFDGKAGWISTPQGWGALAGTQLKQVQGDMFRQYFLLLTSDRLAGRSVNALEDGTLEIGGEGQIVKLGFNSETGLPERIVYDAVHAAGPPVTVLEEYHDFRDIAGVKIPFRISITQGGQKFAEVTVNEVKINSGLKVDDLVKRP